MNVDRVEPRSVSPIDTELAAAIAASPLVRLGAPCTATRLPLVVEPAGADAGALAWVASHRALIAAAVVAHGAILFRGFAVHSVPEFDRFLPLLTSELLSYNERTSPRREIANRIYTSTEYPADQAIFPHNEHSYALTVPRTLVFWCHIPAGRGGETPLADTREVYARIDPAVREKFERLGWMYVRNFDNRVGLSWQTVFQTPDRAEVEAYCAASRITCEWLAADRLRTVQVRNAVMVHPQSGERSWFNHATFFHLSTLPQEVQASLRRDYGDGDLPNNTFYGDGTPIEEDVAEHLRESYRASMVSFPWRKGDVLLVDNIVTAHARNSFTGARRILVALADPVSRATT